MPVVDVRALRAVDILHLAHQVLLHAPHALDPQNIVRVDRALGETVASRHGLAIPHLEAGAIGDVVHLFLAVLGGDDHLAASLALHDGDDAVDLGDDRLALGLASLKELFDPGQARRDVIDARHASRMEGAHGQLGAGLADGLGGDDADRLAYLDQLARREVTAVAPDAHPVPRAARQHRTDFHLFDARILDGCGRGLVDQLVLLDQHLAGLRMQHGLCGHPPSDPVPQGFDDLLDPSGDFLDGTDDDSLGRAAVFLPDDHVLGDVDQAPGEVSRVGGPQSGVG